MATQDDSTNHPDPAYQRITNLQIQVEELEAVANIAAGTCNDLRSAGVLGTIERSLQAIRSEMDGLFDVAPAPIQDEQRIDELAQSVCCTLVKHWSGSYYLMNLDNRIEADALDLAGIESQIQAKMARRNGEDSAPAAAASEAATGQPPAGEGSSAFDDLTLGLDQAQVLTQTIIDAVMDGQERDLVALAIMAREKVESGYNICLANSKRWSKDCQ